MLKTIFNKAAKPSYLPEKPIVLVSTLHDDKNRGDSHGYIGIGKMIAEKLGGAYHYVDETVLQERYADGTDWEKGLYNFVEEFGTPDIFFCRYIFPAIWSVANEMGKRSFVISEINDNLTPYFSPLRKIVAHHLTPSLLQEEGKKFDAAYPDLPRPLVAVMMANHSTQSLPEILTSRLQTTGPSTIFVCSGRRTSTDSYNDMIGRLKSSAEENGVSQSQVVGYNFEKDYYDNVYNPYMGLLDRADHIVVCGDSMSIVSEALATGKSVHLCNNHDGYKSLERKGYISFFNETARNTPLETTAMPPLNRTAHIADRIIRQYRRAQQRKLGFIGAVGAYLRDG